MADLTEFHDSEDDLTGDDFEDDSYDDPWDRACSYPCHICGEEDDFDDDEDEDADV